MKPQNFDCPIQYFPAPKRLSALALSATAAILMPAAQAQVAQEKPTGGGTHSLSDSSGEIPSESKAHQPKFQRLPSIAGTQESLAFYSVEVFPKFSPLPSLEDLPAAPEGLVELAESLAIDANPIDNPYQQGKKTGSDFNKKSVKTEGILALQRPLAPLDILKKTDAIASSPDDRKTIEEYRSNSMNLSSLQNTPDPRYLRHWPANQASWASPAFCYKPLYFEQINLERYGIGYSCPTNALVSGGKFFADATLLPVKLLKNPPHSCECTLGHRRPGDCTPVQKPAL